MLQKLDQWFKDFLTLKGLDGAGGLKTVGWLCSWTLNAAFFLTMTLLICFQIIEMGVNLFKTKTPTQVYSGRCVDFSQNIIYERNDFLWIKELPENRMKIAFEDGSYLISSTIESCLLTPLSSL